MHTRRLYDFDRKKLYKEVWKEPMVIQPKSALEALQETFKVSVVQRSWTTK